MGRKLLIIGSVFNFLLAVAHIAALFFLDWAFEFSGIADEAAKYTETHHWINYAATILVAIIFFLMGFYGLSCARVIKKFPLLKPGIAAITLVYLLRGILGLAYEFLSQERWINGMIFSTVALLVGICYLSGFLWRWHGTGQGKYYETESLKK